MPPIYEILKELTSRGIKVRVVGDRLNVKAPQGVMTPRLQGLISENKQEIVQLLNALSNKQEVNKKAPHKTPYPLSSAQRRMYILYEFDRDSIAYNMPSFFRVYGKLSVERLAFTFGELLNRYEIFRTSFGFEGDEAVQYVHEDVSFQIDCFEDFNSSLDKLVNDFVRPFDLSSAPLFRVSLIKVNSEEHILLFDIHHIINDGASHGILMNAFVSLYNGEPLPDIHIHYKDYAVWQQEASQQESIAADKAYWLDLYAEPSPLLDLPTDYERPRVQSQQGAIHGFEITGDQLAGLRFLSASAGTTMYMTLLSLFGILLSKLSNQSDIVIGSPASGRVHADLEEMLGMFVNTLALRLEVDAQMNYEDYLHQLKTRVLSCFDHQGYQYEALIDALQLSRDTSRNPLFDVMFTYDQADTSGLLALEDLELFPFDHNNSPAKFDMTLSIFDQGDRLAATITYSTVLFRASTIRRLADYFLAIVEAVLANSNVLLADIDILAETEKTELLETFNTTTVSYAADQTVVDLFEQQVLRTPQKVAARYIDETLTYQILNEKANGLARTLREKGVGAKDVVGIIVDPCLEMLVGLLGILKAGAAFLPIDHNYPLQRISYILKDSGVKHLLSLPDIIDKLGYEGKYMDISAPENYSKTNANLENSPQAKDLCYLIYTSGSTGLPKGVLIEHHSLVNLCHWHNTYYQVSSKDNSTKYAGFGFDASVWEIFPYLLAGATIHVIDQSMRLDLAALNAYFHLHQITISFLPTQLCEQFVKLENHSLRYLLTGGDKLNAIGPTAYQVVNNYGPTEGTVVASSYVLSGSDSNIPIGKPIYNTQIYILDDSMKLLPKGVEGELYIGGSGLARGYLNAPELTAERFVDNPYRPGTRIYRSGDIARWLDDGNLAFLGRADEQVKLRGFRIELGEIRHHLMLHEQVEDCLVMLKSIQGEDCLVAYFMASVELENLVLRDYLLEVLPEYMVPLYYVQIEAFPLTANGKLAKKALPLPELEIGEDFQAPNTEIEQALVDLWAEVLKLPANQISVNQGFFELGGHSLKATILVNRINDLLHTEIPLRDVFQYPTIRLLSTRIREFQKTNPTGVDDLILLDRGLKTDKNLFFIHDGSGDVHAYVELSYRIENYHCWGIRSATLKQLGPVNVDLKEVATSYIEKIKKIQPVGPYNLAGWSLGGIIAFEIVNQLEFLGEEVAVLWMIDSVFHHMHETQRRGPEYRFNLEEEKLKLIELFGIDLTTSGNLTEDIEQLWAAAYEELVGNKAVEFRSNVPGEFHPIIPNFKELDIKSTIQYVNTIRSLSFARSRYLPDLSQSLRAQLVYIAAAETRYNSAFLSKYFERKLINKELAGDHFSLLSPPQVMKLANLVDAGLSIRETKHSIH